MIENWKIDKRGRENVSDEVLVLHFYQNPDSDEGFILVGGNNRNIQMYSIRNATLELEMEGHTDSVTCMARDGNLLYTGSDDKSVRQWELTQNTCSGIIGVHEEGKVFP